MICFGIILITINGHIIWCANYVLVAILETEFMNALVSKYSPS